MLNEDTKLLIVAHKRAADAASILNTGTAQLAAGVGEVADSSCVALYVTLLGGLADSEHDLPPPSQRFQGTGVRQCYISLLHSYSNSITVFG